MPSPTETLFEAGLAHARAGRHGEAAASFAQVLSAEPSHLGALVSLGSALRRLGRDAEAEAHYRRALALSPAQPLALANLCVLLNDAERHAEALSLAETALATRPGLREARIARANALTAFGRHALAYEEVEALAAAEPASPEIQQKLGQALTAVGRFDEAVAALDRAVALAPDDPLARLRRGTLKLQLGRWASGWDDYEHRFGLAALDAHAAGLVAPRLTNALPRPLTVAEVTGRRVLLIAEQGVGDQIMFASIIPDLAARAASVTCICEPRLVGLFRHSFPSVSFAAPAEAQVSPSEVDAVVALGSLGGLFRRSADAFPGTTYLRPRPEVTARWAERLGPRPKGLRIGLSWRGGTGPTRRWARSMPLETLAPVLALPGCEFVSLQYGDVDAEVRETERKLATSIRSFPRAEIDDFEDLAGLVEGLDVVVSVQTALVHLCGAIGKDCLALLPRLAEWRYGTTQARMPWYGSVRLLRQPSDSDWGPVVEAVADELSARLGLSPDGRS